MSVDHLNPPSLPKPHGYTHIIKATGGTTIYIAGQGAYDVNGRLVGPNDHYEQSRQAFRNLRAALEAAGASPKDVVKATFYVVRSSEAVLADFARGLNDALEGEHLIAASTFVGVERLAFDEMLIEIDAIAVIG